jgi:hypothetical protein
MKSKITIIDIAKTVEWSKVVKALKYYYPEDKNDYLPVFNKLKTYKKTAPKDSKEKFNIYVSNKKVIEFAKNIKDIVEYYNYYSMSTITPRSRYGCYSMSFRPWKETASLPVAEQTLYHYRLEEIIAHYIWEITFYGTEQDMKKEGKKLFEMEKEAKKQIKSKTK